MTKERERDTGDPNRPKGSQDAISSERQKALDTKRKRRQPSRPSEKYARRQQGDEFTKRSLKGEEGGNAPSREEKNVQRNRSGLGKGGDVDKEERRISREELEHGPK